MNRFGPTRGEMKLRLAISAAGLALLAGALVLRGVPTSAGGWEAVGIAALFFGGSAAWNLRKLLRRDHG